jgi:nitrate/nitrite transporter NarK
MLWCVSALVVFCSFWYPPTKRGLACLLVGTLGSLILGVASLVAMYWPIYMLGAAI